MASRTLMARAMSNSRVRKKCGAVKRLSLKRFAMVLRIWLTGTSSNFSTCGAPNTAPPPAKFSTSCLVTRPSGPLPTTRPISMPFSSASCFAKGLAFTRPLFAGADGAAEAPPPNNGFGAGTLPVAAGLAFSGAGAGAAAAACSCTCSCFLGSSDFGAASALGAAAASPASNAVMSSPALPSTASTLSTAADLPFSTPMCRSTPSVKLSNSMVALSVSISASTSPLFTASPTFLCQALTTPSVMVSLNFGMRTISAMVGLSFSLFRTDSSSRNTRRCTTRPRWPSGFPRRILQRLPPPSSRPHRSHRALLPWPIYSQGW